MVAKPFDYSSIKSVFKTTKSYRTENTGMRLVEIIPRLTPVGGAEKMVVDMCIDIVKRRKDVDLLFIRLYDEEDNYLIRSLKSAGVKTISLGKKKGIDFSAAKKLSKVVHDFNPDVIHSHLVSLVTIFLADLHNEYPVFHTIHTTPNKQSKGSRLRPNNLFERYLFKTSIFPVSISENIKKDVANFYRKNLNEIPVVRNGVNLDMYSNKMPFSKREIDFLFAGRFIESKNVPLIIKAFEQFDSTGVKTNLFLAGNGPRYDECLAYVHQNNLNNIQFLGFRNDVHNILKKTKVLVMASTVEGNPIIINEAIASGTYVLSSDVGGISDVVNKSCGLLYKDISANTLFKKKRFCVENIKIIEESIKANFDTNVQKISIINTVDDYLSLFKIIFN